jgi:hypothetical protein
MQSRAYLAKSLNEYEKAITGDISKDTINKWYNILKRYNLLPQESQPQINQISDLDDFIEA